MFILYIIIYLEGYSQFDKMLDLLFIHIQRRYGITQKEMIKKENVDFP